MLKEGKYTKKKLKNLLIIYEFDSEYIKRTLTFFKLFSAKEQIPLNFYAKRWNKNEIEDQTLYVDENFEVKNEKIKNLNFFQYSLILSLNSEFEKEKHKKISDFLKKNKIFQLNPFYPSSLASDKFRTIKKLEKSGINIPFSILIEFKDRKNLKNIIKKLLSKKTEGFYIQPNYGTEGKQTYFFTKMQLNEQKNLFIETVNTIIPEQPVIIKEKRGNIYYFNEKEKNLGYRDVVLRIFIFEWNKKIFSNWCFFEICPSENFPISSPYKGGRILNFNEVKNNLYFKVGENFIKFDLKEEYKIQIISEIEKIFKIFNRGIKEKLKIGGMDILL